MVKRVFCGFIVLLMILTAFGCKANSNQTQAGNSPASSLPESTQSAAEIDFPDDYTDALPENAEDGLTLHAFNWTYREIMINLENISNAGFKNVLTMPVQQPKGGGASWWAFYQPLSFSIADNSSLGSKEDLEALCREAEKFGICILADIVVNHMANIDDNAKEADGTPTVLPAVADYEPLIYNNRNEDIDGIGVTFHHNKNANGSGSETQYYAYGNLPDLDTSNPYVQERVLALLIECIDAGVDGFRFDAAKHIETAQDPQYPSDFWDNTLEKAKEYYRSLTGRELYVYGEILNSPSGRDLSFYTDYMRVTDDGFTAQFKSAFTSKDPNKILGASLKGGNAENLIAWVESHDEYVSSNSHYNDVRVAKFWSVIAAKKGLGGLFLARPTTELTVGQIGSYAFESEYVAVSNRFHNRFYAADSYESADGTCYINEKIAPSDQGVLILNAGDVDPEKVVAVSVPHLENGNYYDALTGRKVVVSDHKAHVQFDPSGIAVITRSRDLHPQLEISERDCSFAGEKTILLQAKNSEESYFYFNSDPSEKHTFAENAEVSLGEHVKDGKVDLTVVLRTGRNTFEQTFTYTPVQHYEDGFNLINLDPKYLNGDYELYIWSWEPGRWSKDYEIRGDVIVVDTSGMTGFLIAIFEKGYQVTDINSWDPNVIKQSGDIKGELLKQGFSDMSGF